MFLSPLWLVLNLLAVGLRLIEVLIVVRVILSFVPAWRRTPFGAIIVAITEPMLLPFRRMTRVQGPGMGIDFSPMVVLLIIHVIRLVLRI